MLIDDERRESAYYKFVPKFPEDIVNFIGYCNTEGYVVVGSNPWWKGKTFAPFTTYDELEVGKEYLVMMFHESSCLKIINVDKFTSVFKELVSNVFKDEEK